MTALAHVSCYPLSAALDISGCQRAPSGAKSAPWARPAVLSSSDREPARTGTPRANRSEYTGSRRETPRGGLAGWQLTADPSGVRGEEEWLRSRSAVRTPFSGQNRELQLVLCPKPPPPA